MGLRLLACGDCEFESRWRRGGLSFVSVMCCQVEVSASGWSLVQRIPTERVVCLSVIVKPQWWGGLGPLGAVAPWKKKINEFQFFTITVYPAANLEIHVVILSLYPIHSFRCYPDSSIGFSRVQFWKKSKDDFKAEQDSGFRLTHMKGIKRAVNRKPFNSVKK
jgi:hypothetical protein